MPEKLVAANPSTQGRKRKQSPTSSMHALSSSSSTAPAYQQSTITDHFSPRDQSPPALKRSKSSTVEPFLPPPSSGSTPSSKSMNPITEAEMLDFGSKDMPVDLTSSQVNNARTSQKPACAPGKPPSFQSYNGARKLKVKNLRKSTKNNTDAYFNNTWESLNNVLTAIFNREKVPVSLEELYRGVENICRAEKAPQLFERLEARCEGYVTKQLKVQVERDVGENSIEAARVVEAAWTHWGQQLVDYLRHDRDRC
jgi:cullin-4